MAATMKCYLHTSRDALIRCKQCGKPVCHECRINTDIGAFCSQECYQKTKLFNERAAQHETKKTSYWAFRNILRKLVGLAIIIAILWGLWAFGPAPVSDFLDNIFSMITGFF